MYPQQKKNKNAYNNNNLRSVAQNMKRDCCTFQEQYALLQIC